MNRIFNFLLVVVLSGVLAVPALAQDEVEINPLDGQVFSSSEGPQYAATWDGWTLSQEDLPDDRIAHSVEDIEIPVGGPYVLLSVECMVETEAGRVAARENGAVFNVREEGQTYTVWCGGGHASGFSITLEGKEEWADSENPLAGYRFESETDEVYDILVGGSEGTWWYQAWLPSDRQDHEVSFWLWPNALEDGEQVGVEYVADSHKCNIEDSEGNVVVNHGNKIHFTVEPGDDVVMYTAICDDDPATGFSVYPAEEQSIDWTWEYDEETGAWEQLNELLND